VQYLTVGALARRRHQEPGLRGGHIRFGDKTRTILLAGVRYIQDLTVTGPIHRDDADRATADLQVVAAGGGAYRLRLSWQALRPEDLTEITGTLNDRPFTAWIPLTCTNTRLAHVRPQEPRGQHGGSGQDPDRLPIPCRGERSRS